MVDGSGFGGSFFTLSDYTGGSAVVFLLYQKGRELGRAEREELARKPSSRFGERMQPAARYVAQFGMGSEEDRRWKLTIKNYYEMMVGLIE